ncbi:endonuclease/exonuclease/phosphatase family protein [bacterium SCSIO 12741]|nr:endonuclease/exonuclease/phosphatase family protein [bacterium SCSIO 12741]
MSKSNKLRVGTFNLYNLALPEVNYYPGRSYSEKEYYRKLNWIRHQMTKMRPDIMGMQEIFHDQCIEDLIAKKNYHFASGYTPPEKKGELSPFVGLLSKYPILEKEVYTEFKSQLDVDDQLIPFKRFSRPILRCRLEIKKDLEVDVFVSHLKSKRPIFPEHMEEQQVKDPIELARGHARALLKRSVEAVALREILAGFIQHTDHPVIVLGDLNDSDRSTTTTIIQGDPPWANERDLEKKKRIWDVLLYNVKNVQARRSYKDHYYTHIHNGHHEALDHILVSQEFHYHNQDGIGSIEYVRVFNDHLIDKTLTDEKVPRWKSDHAQVLATLELK